jgi:hypothetical protein
MMKHRGYTEWDSTRERRENEPANTEPMNPFDDPEVRRRMGELISRAATGGTKKRSASRQSQQFRDILHAVLLQEVPHFVIKTARVILHHQPSSVTVTAAEGERVCCESSNDDGYEDAHTSQVISQDVYNQLTWGCRDGFAFRRAVASEPRPGR